MFCFDMIPCICGHKESQHAFYVMSQCDSDKFRGRQKKKVHVLNDSKLSALVMWFGLPSFVKTCYMKREKMEILNTRDHIS